ncbi:hypothetical protein V6N13_095545 [Hibiscus sabdariffa]|uniref:Uncharacterized protein n=1 Tax=Hibiscus sabdariffa TaxID=183260 RepID=A0ABR2AIG3_9ROSI
MDLDDATNVLFFKIRSLDPQNASKIMGYILIQDLAEGDLLRLAFGPEDLLRPSGFGSDSKNSQNPLRPSSPSLIPRNVFLEPSWPPASSPKPSPALSYENIRSGDSNNDFIGENEMSDYFSFLSDSSTSENEDFVGHRRGSYACFGTAEEVGGFGGLVGGYKPCLYFARGFCMHGDDCKFSHGSVDVKGAIVDSGSASRMGLPYRQHEEMMRVRAAGHQQRLAGASSPLHCQKNMNDNLSSKKIYLTFRPDSTFSNRDVSNYFSMFGPVHDVRIPFKRMFGFVTFVHPKTVKLVLSRGNPHFICDSRVIVKPFKENGKDPDKRQHMKQHFESPCSSPAGVDSRGLPEGFGVLNTQQMMSMRELEEQTVVQQAIELQRRRLTSLQLPDDGVHHPQRSPSDEH